MYADKIILAGNLEYGGQTITVHMIEDKTVVKLDRSEPEGFLRLGHLSEYTHQVSDLLGVVNLWQKHADNFKKK
jgi:hypothetical protein